MFVPGDVSLKKAMIEEGMTVRQELRAYGRVDLDGTHRAVIETDAPEGIPGARADRETPQFLKLTKNGKTCGCILSEVKSAGGQARIFLDRFKLWHLQIKDGDSVAVEALEPSYASRVELQVPGDFSPSDAARFIGKPVVKGEKTALFTFSGESRVVVVRDTRPSDVVVLSPTTDIAAAGAKTEAAPVTYGDVGGLEREIRLIREVVEYPIRFPDVFERLGVSQPRGIILHGPPGTGKTLIARALANEIGAHFYSISGPEVYSKWYGKSEESLRNIFEEAVKAAPAVVVIDELDALVPRREKVHGDQEQRIVATFLTQMDGLKELRDVVVVGTTNRLGAIDPALRRGGRFEIEVHIGVPDSKGRAEILAIHTRRMPLAPDADMARVAESTVGFVGADIASLCREAAYNSLRRTIPRAEFESGRISGVADLSVSRADFEAAQRTVRPSAMKEFIVEIPRTSWDDIGGLEELKRLLIENISYAITRREAFLKVGVAPARGVLLYGPPGTGKTLLAKAVASQCGANFIAVKGPEVRSKWLGESEEKIRFLFARARQSAPCVIFFDELDAIVSFRGRDITGVTDAIINQLLAEMDGVESEEGVFVIGATNRIDLLDPAVLRPGRFDYYIEVPMPDLQARRAIFGVHLRGKPLGEGIRVEELAEITDGFSGAEIAEACRAAAWNALREAGFEAEAVSVTMSHLMRAISEVQGTRDKLRYTILARTGGGRP
jgi:transitional endoplasmic reticulum ATPase